jgi:hypothetical protein
MYHIMQCINAIKHENKMIDNRYLETLKPWTRKKQGEFPCAHIPFGKR